MDKTRQPIHKVAVKRPGEPLEVVDFQGTYRCDVKPLIDNEPDTYLQYVAIRDVGDRCLCMACDDSGLMKQLPVNFNMLTQSGNHSFYEKIVGTVVFMVYQQVDVWEHEIWDFELLDLNEDDIQCIERMLSTEAQQHMAEIAAMDPFTVKEHKLIFEPIEDIKEYLMPSPTDLEMIPIVIVATYLFSRWSVNHQFSFYTDKRKKCEYVTGIEVTRSDPQITIYCRSQTLAYEVTVERNLAHDSLEEVCHLMQQYLTVLHSWSLPAFVYVTRETYKKLTTEEDIEED